MLKSSRRRPLLGAAVATAALSVTLSVPVPASALDGTAHPARTWTGEAVPFSDANLVDVVNTGRGRTWAAGFTVRNEGKVTRFQPVVAERSEPGGAWTPVAPATAAAGAVSSRVNAVDANGARDVWLVGDDASALDGRVYTQHFDGTRWQVVPMDVPEKVLGASLLDVDALPGGAWAAGVAQIEVSRTWDEEKGGWVVESRQAGIVRHFDGTAWRDVPLPEPAGDFWYLNAVRAVSADDVWAAGYDGASGSPLLMHYDGSSWEQVGAPGVTDRPGQAQNLAVTEDGEVWLVGEDWSPEDGSTRALVARHDGGEWHRVAVPDVPARLFGLTARPGGGIAVVGQTLGAQRDALAWSWTPTAPGTTGTGAPRGRWKNLDLPQPAVTDPSAPRENSASGVVGGRAGLTVIGTSAAEVAGLQPFVSVRTGRR
ncbi:hypothetical protein [Streptomyces sp. NPDC091416]|uniref:hypothetical protein n=1 Tax=Streptomyces sp. NPDC091416 TaxID=3366003 RepID=UPI0037FCB905